MCMKNNQPVCEYNTPCGHCPDYLNTCMPVIVDGYIFGECDLSYCEFCDCYEECMSAKESESMKLLNYDINTLIVQNMRTVTHEVPSTQTTAQYKILCRLIRQKKIEKRFFDFLLSELYHLSDWRELNYQQMYQFIHVLTYWNYDIKDK